jgi:hypothetical protein
MASVVDKMQTLKTLVDAYGIAVRAGVLTPCVEDEAAFRKMMSLPDVPQSVRAEWERTKGVRSPITLARGVSETEAAKPNQNPAESGGKEDDDGQTDPKE